MPRKFASVPVFQYFFNNLDFIVFRNLALRLILKNRQIANLLIL